MDGFKKRLTDSLQFKISFSIAICILGFALMAGIVAFKSAYDEAHELQDDLLRQVSSFITQKPLSLDVLNYGRHDKIGDAESHIIIQQLGNAPGLLNISALYSSERSLRQHQFQPLASIQQGEAI